MEYFILKIKQDEASIIHHITRAFQGDIEANLYVGKRASIISNRIIYKEGTNPILFEDITPKQLEK